MPSTELIVGTEINKSFRTDKIKGMFDIDLARIEKIYNVSIPIEDKEWNIGLIVGSSGSGKTTIASMAFKDCELFKGFEWSDNAVVDDFNEILTAKEITESLSKVGFSSPPDWLKPFSVLSNGQKMRVELARIILESKKTIIYDEFTSVVDRQVAKVGSSAIQRFIRKSKKQFIAVSCHHDIEEWLEADWIYDTDKKEFSWRRLRRPEIRVDIRKAKQSEWKLFKEFHYLSAAHNNAAHKYIAEINGEPVAWCSVLHFPHPKIKNMKRIHRVVVRPDYQGIGLGIRFINDVSKSYNEKNYRVGLTTGTPAFISGLCKNKHWRMNRKPSRTKETSKSGVLKGSTSALRLTASFEYIANREIA